MILFSTLPHHKQTPLWPAGMMTKVPQRTIRRMKSKMSIPMVRGFGVLYSKDIIDPSLIIYPLLPKILEETTSQVGVKRVAGSGLVTAANGAGRYRQVVFWLRQASHRNYLAAIWP
jgi:hypothetical protein